MSHAANEEKNSQEKATKVETERGNPSFMRRQAKAGPKKLYTKVKFCTYCMKQIKGRMKTHFLIFHKGEINVMKTKEVTEPCKQHIIQQNTASNESNFELYDANILRTDDNKSVFGGRNGSHNTEDYSEYDTCSSFDSKSRQVAHMTCINEISNNTATSRYSTSRDKGLSKHGRATAKPESFLNSAVSGMSAVSEECLEGLLKSMDSDDLKVLISRDKLITKYAVLRLQSLVRRANDKSDNIHQISKVVRTLARLVMTCRKRAPGIFLNDLLRPENFDLVVQVTIDLAMSDRESVASFGRYMGTILAHVISLKIRSEMHANDDEATKASEFKKMFEGRWNYKLQAFEAAKMKTKRRETVPKVSVTEDIIKLRTYLLRSMRNMARKLKNFRHADDWVWLAKFTLARLTYFNKCKRVAVKDLKVQDYLESRKKMAYPTDDVQATMSTTEKMLAKRFDSRIHVLTDCLKPE